jgi:hypothetical protein
MARGLRHVASISSWFCIPEQGMQKVWFNVVTDDFS